MFISYIAIAFIEENVFSIQSPHFVDKEVKMLMSKKFACCSITDMVELFLVLDQINQVNQRV